MTTWLTDANGNKCSVEYFGSEEAAKAALDSLKDCQNCVNCSDCSRYSGCSDCSDCSDCQNCAWLYDKQNMRPVQQQQPAEGAPLQYGAPPIPVIENIHQKVFEAASQPGALKMTSWHCGTTHCRAGWVVTLAGEAGKKLEEFHNTELAAMLIYRQSSPNLLVNPARFYDDAADAIRDMKRMADQERAA